MPDRVIPPPLLLESATSSSSSSSAFSKRGSPRRSTSSSLSLLKPFFSSLKVNKSSSSPAASAVGAAASPASPAAAAAAELSPWQTSIPTELLTHIFSYLRPCTDTHVLLYVCKLWRHVAASPYLWLLLHRGWFGATRLADDMSWHRSCELIEARLRVTKHLPHERLIWASQYGLDLVVSRLLDRVYTAAAAAAITNHDSSTKALSPSSSSSSASTEIPAEHCRSLSLALYTGAQYGHTCIVDLLFKRCRAALDVTYQRENGTTPLWVACYAGSLPIVRTLIEAGAPINAQRDSGSTPLFIAAELGHSTIVSYLLQHQAKPELARADGATPLHVVRNAPHGRGCCSFVRGAYSCPCARSLSLSLSLVLSVGRLAKMDTKQWSRS